MFDMLSSGGDTSATSFERSPVVVVVVELEVAVPNRPDILLFTSFDAMFPFGLLANREAERLESGYRGQSRALNERYI